MSHTYSVPFANTFQECHLSSIRFSVFINDILFILKQRQFKLFTDVLNYLYISLPLFIVYYFSK